MDDINRQRLIRHDGHELDSTWSDRPHDPEWDDFVFSLPDGHHEQTSRWGQVRARYGWKIARFTLKDNGKTVAGCQVQLRTVGRFGKAAYITYGPCVGCREERLTKVCVEELKEFLGSTGVTFAIVGLPYEGDDMIRPLEKNGFFRKPARLHPRFMEATLVIDLTKQPEEILADMRPSTRNNVRRALKKGISVVEGSAEDIETFRQLMLTLCKRRGTSPNPPQPDFFHYLWKHFSEVGWIKIFKAMHGHETVAAALAIPFRNWFRVWKVGWSGQYGNLKPNEAMEWEMIQYARRSGHHHFDLVELDPTQIREMLSRAGSEPMPQNTNSYKLGFGGKIKMLPGAYCYFPNPLVRTAMRLGLFKLLDSSLAVKFTQMYDKTVYT